MNLIDYKEIFSNILRFITNRLFVLTVLLGLTFIYLVSTLFELQIVQGTYHVPVVPTSQRIIFDNAPRGEIFDVNGRPLAINIPIFTVSMDPSIIFDVSSGSQNSNEALNTAFLLFMSIMENNGQEINIDSEFLISTTTPRTFSASLPTQRRWKNDLGIDEEFNAAESYEALLARFEIPQNLTRDEQFILVQLRTALQLQRWNVNQVRLALDIDHATVATLEEHGTRLAGIRIMPDWLRYYPEGRYMTNIVGYLRPINAADLASNAQYGYTAADLFGATGIERAFEHQLRGTRGETIIEIDNMGRRVGVISQSPPVAGDDIFLTIDSVLQRQVYYAIEDQLVTVLLNRLRSQQTIFAREILASTIRSNNINSLLIMDAEQTYYPISFAVQTFINSNSDIDPDDLTTTAYRTALNNFISENILNGRINLGQIIGVMEEQDIIDMVQIAASPQFNPVGALIEIIEARMLTPQMVNIDPATGSAVITDIHTGALIAAVNYPTFNGNHLLPHSFDLAYFHQINNDPSRPQYERAFREMQAPGSTFKMITGLAAMSQGVISPSSTIFDNVVFRDAGVPYVHCMGSHGLINIVDAIAVSCNYFFNRVAWNLGNHRTGQTLEGIATLNYYMMALGLGSPTGIEISEAPTTVAGGFPNIASPEAVVATGRSSTWRDGYTTHVSIGQGFNAYTATSMAKVMATLATGGTRLEMTLISRINHSDGTVTLLEPYIEYELEIQPEHINAIHQGMLATQTRGTARGVFAGFPIQIGVKSGTAEVDTARLSHSSYGGFAPFDNPQIAFYIMMPHGDSPFLRSLAGHVNRGILEAYFGIGNTQAPPQSNLGIH